MRPLTRRNTVAIILFTVLVLLCYLATRLWFFVHIFMPHSGIGLTQDQVALAHNTTTPDPRPQHIPKIIHQIFHNWHDLANETLPADWEAVRHTCIALNADWEYKLWTPKPSRDFLELNYPWFLPTYDGFRFPVQKIDALRYFLMLHYGGIYLDLDNGCKASLEPLLYYPCWLTDGGHGALSNNILGAAPNHPFWQLLISEIVGYAWNYPLPYLAVSYATGQWFETAVWEEYHRRLPKGEEPLMRLKMDMRPGADPWVFFTQERGGTWNQWDNELFSMIGNNVPRFLFYLAAILGVFCLVGYMVVRVTRHALRGKKGYQRLDQRRKDDSDVEMDMR